MTAARVYAEVAFGSQPGNSAPVYTDLTGRVREDGWEIKRGRQRDLGRMETGTVLCQLDNRDRAFDPDNTASPYYPNVKPMRRMRLRAEYPWGPGQVEDWAFTGGTDQWSKTGAAGGSLSRSRSGGYYGGYLRWTWDATAGETILRSEAVPALAGQPIVGTVRLHANGGAIGTTTAQIEALDANGATLATTTGTGVSPTAAAGAWTRATVAAVLPAGATAYRLRVRVAVNPGAGRSLDLSAVVADLATAVRDVTLATGLIENWPQVSDGSDSWVTVEAADALGVFADSDLPESEWHWWVTEAGPLAWYSLEDESTAHGQRVRDRQGHQDGYYRGSVAQVDGGPAATTGGKGVQANSGASNYLWGFPDPFRSDQPVSESAAYHVLFTVGGNPAQNQTLLDFPGCTVYTAGDELHANVFHKRPAGSPGSAGTTDWFYLMASWDWTGHSINDGRVHAFTIVTFYGHDNTNPSITAQAYLDGVLLPELGFPNVNSITLSEALANAQTTGRSMVSVLLNDQYAGSDSTRWKGAVYELALWQETLTGLPFQPDWEAMTEAGALAGEGERSGARGSRILRILGWPLDSYFGDTGTNPLQAVPFSGTGLDYLSRVANSELGALYVNKAGVVRIRDRHALLRPGAVTPTAEFGDRGPQPEITVFNGDPSVEGGTDGWTAYGGRSLTRTAGTAELPAADGNWYMRVGALAPGGDDRLLRFGVGYAANIDVSLNLRVRRRTGEPSATVQVFLDTGSGSVYDSRAYDLPEGEWVTIKAVLNTGPTGGTFGLRSVGASDRALDVDAVAQVYGVWEDPPWSATSQFAVPGELPYERLVTDYSRFQIVNEATAQREGGQPQTFRDQASVDEYLRRAAPGEELTSLLVQDDATALGYAQWVVRTNSDPKRRVTAMVLRPMADYRVMEAVLDAELETRWRVNWRPAIVDRDVLLQGYTLRAAVGLGSWVMECWLSEADTTNYLVLDDPVLAKFANSPALAF